MYSYLCNKCKNSMIIARDVKIVPRAAGEWDNTSSAITLFARVAYKIFFYDRTKNEKKQR
jgi:hypothetical protein